MKLDSDQFEPIYAQKGRAMLDQIFGEFTPERSRVRLAGPRHEREIVFVVEFNEKGQFDNVIESLCEWLGREGNFERLHSLMLT